MFTKENLCAVFGNDNGLGGVFVAEGDILLGMNIPQDGLATARIDLGCAFGEGGARAV